MTRLLVLGGLSLGLLLTLPDLAAGQTLSEELQRLHDLKEWMSDVLDRMNALTTQIIENIR